MKERSINTMSLDGGCLCFNLVNTISHRKRAGGHDYISSYTQVLQWARKTGALPHRQIDLLDKLAIPRPHEASAAAAYFREIRELLYQFFSAVAARRFPGEKTTALTNNHIQHAIRQLEFDATGFPVVLRWQATGVNLREPIWAALHSAWEVLNSPDQLRIKECEACGWLFLDSTRNNRKRWCNPATCGNADKAKRYYQRKKDNRSTAG